MKTMQFNDLHRQYLALKEEIDAAMAGAVDQAHFISGPQVARLEEELAAYVGVRHCVTCGNGTDALLLALLAWGVGPGDAVFVPSFTFFATAEAVSRLGATPVFVDVEEDTFNMSPASLEEAIRRVRQEGELTPRAVIPVDLFGQPADYFNIGRICQKNELPILEDGAQGMGGEILGKKACSFGTVSVTSFFPAKPLGCYGDGGALFTNDDDAAGLLRSLCVHGKGEYKYDNVRLGTNSRLDTLQAAILLPKLKALKESELMLRNRWANRYTQQLKGIVKTPAVPQCFYSSWAQYTIRLESKEQRDGLQAALKQEGIPSMVYYPKALHLQTVYQSVPCKAYDLPVSQRLPDIVLSLPMHPYLTEEEVDTVCAAVARYCHGE